MRRPPRKRFFTRFPATIRQREPRPEKRAAELPLYSHSRPWRRGAVSYILTSTFELAHEQARLRASDASRNASCRVAHNWREAPQGSPAQRSAQSKSPSRASDARRRAKKEEDNLGLPRPPGRK